MRSRDVHSAIPQADRGSLNSWAACQSGSGDDGSGFSRPSPVARQIVQLVIQSDPFPRDAVLWPTPRGPQH